MSANERVLVAVAIVGGVFVLDALEGIVALVLPLSLSLSLVLHTG